MDTISEKSGKLYHTTVAAETLDITPAMLETCQRVKQNVDKLTRMYIRPTQFYYNTSDSICAKLLKQASLRELRDAYTFGRNMGLRKRPVFTRIAKRMAELEKMEMEASIPEPLETKDDNTVKTG